MLKFIIAMTLLFCAYPAQAEKALFEITDAHSDSFVVKLHSPGAIRLARRMLAGRRPEMIIGGTIVKASKSYNPGWSFHLDPDSIVFGEIFIELCDAAILGVEKNLDNVGGKFLPNNFWCPWSARIMRELKKKRRQ